MTTEKSSRSSGLLKKSRVSAAVGLLDVASWSAMGRGGLLPGLCRVSLSGRGLCQQFRDADQVVGGDREGEHRLGLGASADLDLCKPGLRLDPAEDLLDALADPLA